MVSISRFFLVVVATSILWLIGLRVVFNWVMFRWKGWEPRGFAAAWPVAVRGAVALLMLLSLLVLVWSFVEPYFPVVERVEIRSPKIKEPIRIVHLSDFHSDPEVRAEDKVVNLVRELKPNLILFTGDGVNSDEGIPIFRRTMQRISKIAPVYGVRGNWEVWWFQHVDSFKGTGIHELNGNAVPLTVRDQTIWLGGVEVDSEHLIYKATKPMPKEAFRIFLHHYPAAQTKLKGKVDLLLSGDTHGGQIVFPILGPLVRIGRWGGKFYESGLHQFGDLKLYVNRGIGMEGSNVPRTRFMCPPEVTLIELRGLN